MRNNMNDKKTINKWIPIIVFYEIAVLIRFFTLKMGRPGVADISFSWGGLIFLAILIFGAWGIGHITLYNFSTHGFFQFTPAGEIVSDKTGSRYRRGGRAEGVLIR